MTRDGDAEHWHGDDDPFLSDEGAETWAAWAPVLETGTKAVTEALLDAAGVGPGQRILDLACGLGHVAAAAVARGAEATGLDLNGHMLRRALPGPTYAEGDMLTPPAGPWDAVVSRFGAHHADPAWLNAAIEALAPGGRIAIAEWHPDTALFDLDTDEPMPVEDDADDWVRRFEAAGLQDVTASEVDFTIDFGDEATFQAFLEHMVDGHASRAGAPDGRQHNRAFIVAGHT